MLISLLTIERKMVQGKLIDFGEKTLFIHLCILNVFNDEERIWSVRITLSHRAIGILDGDTVTWFWVGSHDDYEKFFG
jgi:hypothetical protein